jgi:hypothetical protein
LRTEAVAGSDNTESRILKELARDMVLALVEIFRRTMNRWRSSRGLDRN